MTVPPIRLGISRAGQPYYDEPVYAEPKAELMQGFIERAIRMLEIVGYTETGRLIDNLAPITRADLWRPLPPILVAYQKINLRWMKPNCKGGLVPR